MTAAIEEITVMRETVTVSIFVFAGRIASDAKQVVIEDLFPSERWPRVTAEV